MESTSKDPKIENLLESYAWSDYKDLLVDLQQGYPQLDVDNFLGEWRNSYCDVMFLRQRAFQENMEGIIPVGNDHKGRPVYSRAATQEEISERVNADPRVQEAVLKTANFLSRVLHRTDDDIRILQAAFEFCEMQPAGFGDQGAEWHLFNNLLLPELVRRGHSLQSMRDIAKKTKVSDAGTVDAAAETKANDSVDATRAEIQDKAHEQMS